MARSQSPAVEVPDPRVRPVLHLDEANAVLEISRGTGYALARAGRYPVPVLRIGRQYRVPLAPLVALLGLGAS